MRVAALGRARAPLAARHRRHRWAGEDVDPAVEDADKALEDGSIEVVVRLVTADVAAGIRRRHQETLARKKRADQSIELGREFVEAYVEYVHFVENIHLAATTRGAHHAEAEASARQTGAKR